MSEDIASSEDGIEGAETGVVEGDGRSGDAAGDEGIAHGGGLIVIGGVVVTTDDEVADFARDIEGCSGVDARSEEEIGTALGERVGTKDEGDVVGGKGVDVAMDVRGCRGGNPAIAEERGRENGEACDAG